MDMGRFGRKMRGLLQNSGIRGTSRSRTGHSLQCWLPRPLILFRTVGTGRQGKAEQEWKPGPTLTGAILWPVPGCLCVPPRREQCLSALLQSAPPSLRCPPGCPAHLSLSKCPSRVVSPRIPSLDVQPMCPSPSSLLGCLPVSLPSSGALLRKALPFSQLSASPLSTLPPTSLRFP